MSSTEIYGFDINGNAYHLGDVNNSWRSAVAIWSYLEDKYLPPYIPDYMRALGVTTIEECKKRMAYKPSRYSTMQTKVMQEIWDLVDSPALSSVEKICLFTTFDKCLVKREDIPKVVEAFRAFEADTSLKEQANILERTYNDNNCIAIGWNQNSICADSWTTFGGYDEETDSIVPYNCLHMSDHYWLFDELQE